MKYLIFVICLGFVSNNVMANDLWAEFNLKKVQSEIDFTQGQIDELQSLSKYVPKDEYYTQLKGYKDSIRKALASLDSSERNLLIKNYENVNPKLAVTLKRLK